MVMDLSPVRPTMTHASMNRNMDQNVAPGESMKRTKRDLRFLRHNMNIDPNQSKARIRFRGKERKYNGKLPVRN